MRTRTPKSGTKKTPPAKKATTKGAKAAAAAAAAAASTPVDPKLESDEIEESEKSQREAPLPTADDVKPEEVDTEEPEEEAKASEDAEEAKEEPVEMEAVEPEADEEAEEAPPSKEKSMEIAGEAEVGPSSEVEAQETEIPVEGEDGGEEVDVIMEDDEQKEISDMAKKRKMKKEQEIFVGGLDRDATDDEVRKAFEKIGEVVEVRLHRDFATNKNRGFAFVMFASKELADKALAELKNPIIHGKRCGIAASEDNDTLFLGNICNTWTKEAIRRKLKDYGMEGIRNITLVEDTQHEGLSRGFAFLEFSCHADAMGAYKRLQKPDVVFGHPERTAKVAFAEPLREPDAEVMAQVKSVFVDGMPPYWDEDRVKEQFKCYGEIERVVLARNMTTAKRKDFGFVNFATHEAAVECVQGVNNTELGDGKNKAKVRARLANPLPKTQAVKGGMRGGFRIGHPASGGPSRFGRGLGRGRFQQNRGGFPGGRGFHSRGRGGRFSFNDNDFPHSHFRGRRSFSGRGGRRGGFGQTYDVAGDEFAPYPSRGGNFGNGRGRVFQRRHGYPSEGEFGGSSDGWQFSDNPYFYGDVGPGVKRSFSMMEHESGYMEPGRRLYPRYDYAEGSSSRYRDTNQAAGGSGTYSEYYGPNFDSGGYSSFYGNDQSGGGHYY